MCLSSILVATTVIGGIITLSCLIIMMGSLRKEIQARRRERRERRRRHSLQQDYEEEGSEGGIFSRWMNYFCSPADDDSSVDLSSEGEVEDPMPSLLYSDAPPRYEECVGPGAAQVYLPTEAPPPYAMIDSCPVLRGSFGAEGSNNEGTLCTIPLDVLPPYEAVCGAGPSTSLLPLPGGAAPATPEGPTPYSTPDSTPPPSP